MGIKTFSAICLMAMTIAFFSTTSYAEQPQRWYCSCYQPPIWDEEAGSMIDHCINTEIDSCPGTDIQVVNSMQPSAHFANINCVSYCENLGIDTTDRPEALFDNAVSIKTPQGKIIKDPTEIEAYLEKNYGGQLLHEVKKVVTEDNTLLLGDDARNFLKSAPDTKQ